MQCSILFCLFPNSAEGWICCRMSQKYQSEGLPKKYPEMIANKGSTIGDYFWIPKSNIRQIHHHDKSPTWWFSDDHFCTKNQNKNTSLRPQRPRKVMYIIGFHEPTDLVMSNPGPRIAPAFGVELPPSLVSSLCRDWP